jgi:hypothetical protein
MKHIEDYPITRGERREKKHSKCRHGSRVDDLSVFGIERVTRKHAKKAQRRTRKEKQIWLSTF